MGFLFLLFIVLPLFDVVLLARVGRAVGVLPTVALVIVVGAIGVGLAKSQGRRVLRAWQEALSAGRVPEGGVLDGVLALAGAALLITPGVISDVLGLLLLIPLTRAPIARLLSAYLKHQLARGSVRVYGMGGMPRVDARGPTRVKAPVQSDTEIGRAHFRPGEVIDTQGEEIEK
jgi:UPF0716 protein FxsA